MLDNVHILENFPTKTVLNPLKPHRAIRFACLVAAALTALASGVLLQASEVDPDSLSDEQAALLELLSACEKIEDEDTRQRCYEIALKDDEDEDISIPDIEKILEDLKGEGISESVEPISEPQSVPEESPQVPPLQESETTNEPTKKRGLFGRLARAVTSPIRAVMPKSSDNNEQGKPNDEESEQADSKEEPRGTTSWDAVVVRTGRLDQNVHLVLFDDDKLFEYISPPNLRFRKNDTITVMHVETWLTESYRLDGPRGPIQDAHLIPCHREDRKGNVKRKCELMGID